MGQAVLFPVRSALGVGLLIVIVLSIVLASPGRSNGVRGLLRGFVGLLSLELLANFILPCFYLIGSFPPARADPYAGAPYIGFIRGLNTDHSRIFARESLLYPNWSSAFGLADVRSLDAIYYDRYRSFMRNFLLPRGGTRIHGDLVRSLHRVPNSPMSSTQRRSGAFLRFRRSNI